MIKKNLTYVVLVFGLFIFVAPFIYMIIASTQNNEMLTSLPPVLTPGSYAIENIQKLGEKYGFYAAYLNTIIVTVIGTIISTLICTMSGYAFAKFKFKGRKFLFKLLLFTSMVPMFSTMVPLFIIFAKLGLVSTYASLIIPGLAGASSIFMMRQYMYAVPDEMLESARIDGAGEFKIFFKVVAPMSIPSIATAGLTIFVGYWNSYLWPLIIVQDQEHEILSLVIRNMGLTQDEILYGVRYMGLTLSVIPIIIFYIAMQSKMKNSGVSAAIK